LVDARLQGISRDARARELAQLLESIVPVDDQHAKPKLELIRCRLDDLPVLPEDRLTQRYPLA
jgi:hypothetical protein